MKNFRLLVAAAILLVTNAMAVAQSDSIARKEPLGEVAELIAQEEREARAGESRLAPIRSRSELAAYLNSHQASAFAALSNRSRQLFLDSLVFTENGLASYRYRELESELTPRQAYELLGLFGAQKTVGYLKFARASAEERAVAAKLVPVLFDDHKGYRCVPPATCQSSMDHICIGSNCGIYPW